MPTASPARRRAGAPAPRRRRDPDASVRARDPMRQYLHEIGAFPLLGAREEAELAQRIRRDDREALDALVSANLRFVVSVAKKYQAQGVPLADLVSEGNLGLIRAARRFDPALGVRFISYAVWWVRQAILQALAEQSRIVRVPVNRVGKLHRLGRRASALQQELGRSPTRAELAEAVRLPPAEVGETLALLQTHVSLEGPATAGAQTRLLELLPDDEQPAPDAAAIDHTVAASIDAALGRLTPREARILRLYFGLDGEAPLTLEQIGARLGITRERVRQVKQRALLRLRRGSGGALLRQLVD